LNLKPEKRELAEEVNLLREVPCKLTLKVNKKKLGGLEPTGTRRGYESTLTFEASKSHLIVF
jgi:hypothetical protein